MTFSIVALDSDSGCVGIAIATSSIAVGSRCPWVRAGVGAVATQNITDPNLGAIVLDRMESGDSASTAIEKVVRSQKNIQYRQLTAVDANGGTGHFTGAEILGTNGVAAGDSCVAAGNLLASDSVPQAMVDFFLQRDKSVHLAETLVNTLQAGISAGGEEGPLHSAAVLVARQHAWPEVDLRVDWDDEAPVYRLLSLVSAYEPQREDYLLRALSPADAPSYGVPGDF